MSRQRSQLNSDNVFSQSWNDSDVVLVVEGKEVHVHRYMLSLQSPVFKAMFNGNFKDSQQEKIELKDDKYEAMLQFLKLFYPLNMLNEHKVDINDKNVLQILELADKYAAIDIIKQCMKEVGRLKPVNTMRILPYAARHDLPLDKILEVIGNVSTKELKSYAPELGDDSLYAKTLEKKCHTLEELAKRAYTMILFLLDRHVRNAQKKDALAECSHHGVLHGGSFRKTRKCNDCLTAYQRRLIDKYVICNNDGSVSFGSLKAYFQGSYVTSSDVIDLLKILDNIETGL